MTREEFIEYIKEEGVVEDENNPLIFRNVINGYCTRIADYGDNTITGKDICHHCILLNLRLPDDSLDGMFHMMTVIYKNEGILE